VQRASLWIQQNYSFRGYATKDEAIANYHAYFGIGAEPSTQNFGQIQELQAAPALLFHEPAAAGADAGQDNAAVVPPAPAAADPNLLPIVFILVGLLIALVGYILNQ